MLVFLITSIHAMIVSFSNLSEEFSVARVHIQDKMELIIVLPSATKNVRDIRTRYSLEHGVITSANPRLVNFVPYAFFIPNIMVLFSLLLTRHLFNYTYIYSDESVGLCVQLNDPWLINVKFNQSRDWVS